MISPEQIQQALFDRLRTKVKGLKFASRRDLDVDQVPAQPALTCVATQEGERQQGGLPGVLTMRSMVTIFVRAPNDSTATTETELHDYIGQVRASLLRDPGEPGGFFASGSDQPQTTLGGLVRRAWIPQGAEIDKFQGEGGSQGAALIPIEIVADL